MADEVGVAAACRALHLRRSALYRDRAARNVYPLPAQTTTAPATLSPLAGAPALQAQTKHRGDFEPLVQDWGKYVGDNTMATTILARLMHRAHILEFEVKSYRLKEAVSRLTRFTSASSSRTDEASGRNVDYNPDCPACGSLTRPKVGEFNLANGDVNEFLRVGGGQPDLCITKWTQGGISPDVIEPVKSGKKFRIVTI